MCMTPAKNEHMSTQFPSMENAGRSMGHHSRGDLNKPMTPTTAPMLAPIACTSIGVCIQLKKAPAMTEPISVKPRTSRNLLMTLGPRLFVSGSLMIPPGLAGDLQDSAADSFYGDSNGTQMVAPIACRW